MLAVHAHSWQLGLFRPVERLPPNLFPARWRYDRLKQMGLTNR